MSDSFHHILQSLLGPDFLHINYACSPTAVKVSREGLMRSLMVLRDHSECQFYQLVDLNVVDNLKENQRFEVVYHLLSHTYNKRLMIKVNLDENDSLPSCHTIFPNALWYEREAWDLFGIKFDNHPDLRRILTDYNFVGHPLRKDFPLSGYTEVFYDEEKSKVDYKPLDLNQEFRKFDFLSPWEGDWQHLLKAEKDSHEQ